jgi:hypothetical protein
MISAASAVISGTAAMKRRQPTIVATTGSAMSLGVEPVERPEMRDQQQRQLWRRRMRGRACGSWRTRGRAMQDARHQARCKGTPGEVLASLPTLGRPATRTLGPRVQSARARRRSIRAIEAAPGPAAAAVDARPPVPPSPRRRGSRASGIGPRAHQGEVSSRGRWQAAGPLGRPASPPTALLSRPPYGRSAQREGLRL